MFKISETGFGYIFKALSIANELLDRKPPEIGLKSFQTAAAL
ncbi:hypothetical protein FPK15_contig00026-0001 [Flavobacterium psychrophilum]|nr:hypothetical protein FPK15_contig00026-0001 [Flavobacterium psychrophilum]GAW89723.1 hypothetical protein FPS14_contig00029-0001 [Flavobacterium psychrophilum]